MLIKNTLEAMLTLVSCIKINGIKASDRPCTRGYSETLIYSIFFSKHLIQ